MTGDVQDLGINVGQEDHVVKSGSRVTGKEDAGSGLQVGVEDLPVLLMLFTLVARVSSCMVRQDVFVDIPFIFSRCSTEMNLKFSNFFDSFNILTIFR